MDEKVLEQLKQSKAELEASAYLDGAQQVGALIKANPNYAEFLHWLHNANQFRLTGDADDITFVDLDCEPELNYHVLKGFFETIEILDAGLKAYSTPVNPDAQQLSETGIRLGPVNRHADLALLGAKIERALKIAMPGIGNMTICRELIEAHEIIYPHSSISSAAA